MAPSRPMAGIENAPKYNTGEKDSIQNASERESVTSSCAAKDRTSNAGPEEKGGGFAVAIAKRAWRLSVLTVVLRAENAGKFSTAPFLVHDGDME